MIASEWQAHFQKQVAALEEKFPGHVGVAVKYLKDGTLVHHTGDKKWYLSSTVKVFVAVSLLEEIDQKKIKFDQKHMLKKSDYVDGGGNLKWKPVGTELTVRQLFEAMLKESDSTATDILIGLIGLEEWNKDVQKLMPGAGPFTTLLEVRYLMYSKLHPKARTLSNMDFIELRNTPLEKRHEAFAAKIQIPVSELKVANVEEAFEKLYQEDYNQGTLNGFVSVLEKLAKGELLSVNSTQLLLSTMETMKTGDHRLKAGLGNKFMLAQKTGTQIRRSCNVGLARKANQKDYNMAVAVCIDKPSDEIQSDYVFSEIGKELALQ